jgi:methanogenic corrinoid protein MtbC1
MAETLFDGWRKLMVSSLFSTYAQQSSSRYSPEELLQVLKDTIIPELKSIDAVDRHLIDALVDNDGDCAEALAIHQIALLALAQDVDKGLELLANVHARGVPRHLIYSRYLAGAARLIGEYWLDDRRDFAEVTLATGYLQQLVRETSLLWSDSTLTPGQHHRILLLPAGSEHHSFGLSVLGELFRDAGWDVHGGPKISIDELAQIVAMDRYDLIGFSISSERQLDGLAKQIEVVRRGSCSDKVRILVGGSLLVRRPETADQIDADCSTAEGQDVVELAMATLEGSLSPA